MHRRTDSITSLWSQALYGCDASQTPLLLRVHNDTHSQSITTRWLHGWLSWRFLSRRTDGRRCSGAFTRSMDITTRRTKPTISSQEMCTDATYDIAKTNTQKTDNSISIKVNRTASMTKAVRIKTNTNKTTNYNCSLQWTWKGENVLGAVYECWARNNTTGRHYFSRQTESHSPDCGGGGPPARIMRGGRCGLAPSGPGTPATHASKIHHALRLTSAMPPTQQLLIIQSKQKAFDTRWTS